MLIALMSDMHANREAFAACLAHAADAGVARYVFLGDYVGYGADPAWVLDQVQEHVARGAVAVLGNHDAAVVHPNENMNAAAQAAIDWTRSRLSSAHRDFLAGLPLTVEDGDRLYVHANAWSPGSWGYVLGILDARRSLRETERTYTYCGHVHVPALYHMAANGNVGCLVPTPNAAIPILPRRHWLAVMGAVGQPRDGNPAACYGLLDTERDLLTYVRVPYDVERAAQKIFDAGLPVSLGTRLLVGH